VGEKRKLNRRDFLRLSAVTSAGVVVAACAPATPIIIEKEVIKEVAVEKVVKETVVVEKAPPPPQKVDLRVADWPGLEPAYEVVNPIFEADHPGVTVVFEPFGDNFADKLMAQAVAGTAADVLSIFGFMYFTFHEKGQIVDLNPYIDATMTEEDINDFFGWHWNGFKIPETKDHVGMPWKINVMGVFYNKDFFDEFGVDYPALDWDHDDYAEALARLTVEGDDGEIERWGGYIPVWSYDRFQAHVLAYGGHVSNPDDRTKCLLGEPEAQEGLWWMYDRVWDENSLMRSEQIEASGQRSRDLFGQGVMAMNEDGINTMKRVGEVATPNGVRWSVQHVPQGPVRRAALGSIDGWAMYAGSDIKDLAWEFLYFLSSRENQIENTIKITNQLPVRKSLLLRWREEVNANPNYEGVDLDMWTDSLVMGYPHAAEGFVKQARAEDAIRAALERVMLLGKEEPPAFAEVCEEVEGYQTEE
jgi:multiple sugar transport system substrate-binding protein